MASFRAAEALAGLSLTYTKCKIIPLAAMCTPELVEEMKEWLLASIPSWATMSIVPIGEYLGIMMGPAVDRNCLWQKAGAKYIHRVRELAHVQAPVHLSTTIYNLRIITVLGYIMQLAPLPQCLLRRERLAIHKIWHLPPQL